MKIIQLQMSLNMLDQQLYSGRITLEQTRFRNDAMMT